MEAEGASTRPSVWTGHIYVAADGVIWNVTVEEMPLVPSSYSTAWQAAKESGGLRVRVSVDLRAW
jgi:hypothetical protein